MAIALTNQLLLFVGTLLDQHRWLTRPSLIGALSGDPRRSKHRRLIQQYLRQKRQRQRIQKAVYELKRRGYLQERVLGASRGYLITPKGDLRLFELRIGKHPEFPRLPYGKWLMVFFDVPEVIRRKRDWFREGLKKFGFEQVQRSVWVTPYRVQAELREFIGILGLQGYVKPLIVEELSW